MFLAPKTELKNGRKKMKIRQRMKNNQERASVFSSSKNTTKNAEEVAIIPSSASLRNSFMSY
jgi:hypothetical protein